VSDEADRRRVRRAAVHVGLLVGAASAVVVTAESRSWPSCCCRPDPNCTTTARAAAAAVRRTATASSSTSTASSLGRRARSRRGGAARPRRLVRRPPRGGPLAGALRLQRRFVADASHEIRTPLTALTSRTQILERRYRRGEDLTDTLAALRADASVMDAVLTDMLLTAEGTATDAEPAVVDAALTAAAATAAPLAEEAGVRVRVGQGDDAGLRVRLPASPSTGSASRSWTTRCSTPGRRRGRTVGAIRRTGVAIRVRDGGSGIADADRERIFERFARGPESGRRRGFGLGLALVREAAEAAGGRIEIERTSAAGTTMLLWLPQAA
jgi:signal transduction histidine kinase